MGLWDWLVGVDQDAFDNHGRPHFGGDGTFRINAVGESNYQADLELIAGGREYDGASLETVATLVPESENPHDPNAVRVDIDGRTVGYLSRRDAVEFRNELANAGYGDAITTCAAMICGGWDRGGDDRGYFGVRLDLPTKPRA